MKEANPTKDTLFFYVPDALASQCRILGAIIIRDVRAKMAGSIVSYARVALFPMIHLIFLITIYKTLGRTALLGTDSAVYYATGILPFVLFVYPIRSNLSALLENKQLLVFPVVFPNDIIFARIILEVVNSFISILFIFIIFLCVGFDVIPRNPYETLSGIFATILFTSSFCFAAAIIAYHQPTSIQLCVLIGVGFYLSSGMFFLPSQMPPLAQQILYFNPLAHCVEWIRSGYYETYKEGLLDRRYLIAVSVFLLMIGFVMERSLRGKIQ